MAIRTEQTLRRMWDESVKLATESNRLTEDANASGIDAASAEQAAEAHRTAEKAARSVSNAMMLEAADLTDLVNRERQDAGLTPLTPGEPYPADPAPAEQPMADDVKVAPPFTIPCWNCGDAVTKDGDGWMHVRQERTACQVPGPDEHTATRSPAGDTRVDGAGVTGEVAQP
jgi:peptidyl-tRNA hydrolase